MKSRLPRILFGYPRIDEALEEWAKAIEWVSGIKAVPPLSVVASPGGPIFKIDEGQRMYARLVAHSGSGVYTFVEVYPSASGWTDVPSGRTGSAREWNGNVSLTLTPTKYVVLRWFGEVSEWRFQTGVC